MAINVRDEGAKVNSNINVTPMVDVMLVLLIIFMVITPMLNNKVNVDLASVNAPEDMPDANKEDSVVVAITRDGQVYLGANQVALDRPWPQGHRRSHQQDQQDDLHSRRCPRSLRHRSGCGGQRPHRRR